MNDLNTILIEGNLTRDPILKYSTAETEVCTFPIAVNRYFYKKGTKEYTQNVSYFIIECWGHMAALCAEYLKKGRGIRAVGRLRQTSWKDCGVLRERVYIIAEHIEFQPRHDKKETIMTLRPTQEENDKMETVEVEEALDSSSTDLQQNSAEKPENVENIETNV